MATITHCPECDINYKLDTVLRGTYPDDVECAYVSDIVSKDVNELANHIVWTMTRNSRFDNPPIYHETYDLDCGKTHTVWALSKAGGTLTVTPTFSSVEHYEDEDDDDCLSADTLITMADGSVKRMEHIQVGDLVLDEHGVTSVHTFHRGHFNDWHALYYFEDGTVIHETHHHRFYNATQGFWQRMRKWNIGDCAINRAGEKVALVHSEFFEEPIEMFGMWTDSGKYYANGLLSGAAFCNKPLLEDATAEQLVDMLASVDEEQALQLMGLEGLLP